jgi:gamma-glutamylaminecyclotransferase
VISDAKNNVFIYGTLKRGYRNHDDHLKSEKYLGEYRTIECYPLVVANEWFAPVLLLEKGVGHKVVGELYSVGDIKLAELDRLEHTHHTRGYKRILIVVKNIENSEQVEAFAYMNERKNLMRVSSEYMSKYTDRRYIPKDER